jgi:hypothetical protein
VGRCALAIRPLLVAFVPGWAVSEGWRKGVRCVTASVAQLPFSGDEP